MELPFKYYLQRIRDASGISQLTTNNYLSNVSALLDISYGHYYWGGLKKKGPERIDL